MKPLNSRRISWINLKARPFRTVGLMLLIAISSLTSFTGGLLSQSVEKGVASMGQRLGADFMLVPRGYEQKLESALLRGEPSTFYLKGGLPEKLTTIPGVDSVAAQLFLATLNASCCTWPIQLIAYEPKSDFVISPWICANRPVTPSDNEIIVGYNIVGEAGQEINLLGETFRIAARLDRTGMGFDTTVFLPMRRARSLLQNNQANLPDSFELNSVSAIMVRIASDYEVKDVANEILRRHAAEYDLDFVVAKNLISDISRRLTGLTLFLKVLTSLLWIAAAGILFMFFSVLTNERSRELALMQMLGATRGQLNSILIWESLSIAAIGAVAGVFIAAGVTLPFQQLILSKLDLPYLSLEFADILYLGLVSIVLSVIIAPLACLYTLLKNSYSDIYYSMRVGE